MRSNTSLQVRNVHASIQGKKILKGLTISVKPGTIAALMGPNGSGKSTLAHVLMGNPEYSVQSGAVLFCGKNILRLEPDQRARLGLFLAFQYPHEIPGINMYVFLSTACQATQGKNFNQEEFKKELEFWLDKLKLDASFLDRSLNEGFSGGEKKKAEILQLALLKPKIAILDETDSGLDIDSLKIIANAVRYLVRNQKLGCLVITHYRRLLDLLKPDSVHVMSNGVVVQRGTAALVQKLERHGYGWISLKKKNVRA